MFNTAQTTPGPSQNMDYITIRCRATTCHECTGLLQKSQVLIFKQKGLTLEAVLCKGGSTFIQVWIVLPDYCEQFSMWGVPNNVLPEHFEFASNRILIWVSNEILNNTIELLSTHTTIHRTSLSNTLSIKSPTLYSYTAKLSSVYSVCKPSTETIN